MNQGSKKALYTAIVSLIVSVIFWLICFILYGASKSLAVAALSWLMLGNLSVWLFLVFLFYQRHLAEQEKLDLDQLSKAKNSETIFQANRDQKELFAVAQKRLRFFEKWFVPGFSLLLACFEIIVSVFVFRSLRGEVLDDPTNLQISSVLLAVIAFAGFLISRYVTGMSSEAKWQPLRGGGSYMLAGSVLSFLTAISLIFAHYNKFFGLDIMGYVICGVIFVVGVELVLNVVLDIYRPRVAGQVSRLAFDSRLLGIFNEPGGVFHTFASTLDYQFGFKVSQTWFYKLLEKAILPLIMTAILLLYLYSCIVIVGPGEQAIIEHLGSPVGGGKPFGPGMHLKWPWPFDKAYIHSTGEIYVLSIGYEYESGEQFTRPSHLLWGKEHYDKEYNLLVASSSASDDEGTVPVSLVRANAPVHFKINNIYNYIYNHVDSEEILSAICYRELVKFAVSAHIETEEGDEVSLLGAGRKKASEILRKRVQGAADEAKLGVEIVLLGLQGVHPPPDVAEDYQNVIGSVQKKQADVLGAMAERNKVLTSLTGSVGKADKLYQLARSYQLAKEEGDKVKLSSAATELNEAMDNAEGDIFKTFSQARAYSFDRVASARASGERFNEQLKAFKAAPEIYKAELRLSMLEEALMDIRKYVIISDKSGTQVYIIDLMDDLMPSLYDLNLQELQ